jgi:hypothetical protein
MQGERLCSRARLTEPSLLMGLQECPRDRPGLASPLVPTSSVLRRKHGAQP